MILEIDIDYNELDGSDYAMMFDDNGINTWMMMREESDEYIEVE